MPIDATQSAMLENVYYEQSTERRFEMPDIHPLIAASDGMSDTNPEIARAIF